VTTAPECDVARLMDAVQTTTHSRTWDHIPDVNETAIQMKIESDRDKLEADNQAREEGRSPLRVPAHLLHCKETQEVTDKDGVQHSICVQCNTDSPGIPVPLMRVKTKMMWVCNTASLLGVCEASLSFLSTNITSEWCDVVARVHDKRQEYELWLGKTPPPIRQLSQENVIQQFTLGHAADIKYSGQHIGVVVLKIWNDLRCALPKDPSGPDQAETTTIFMQSGYRVRSCTLEIPENDGEEGTVYTAKAMRCIEAKSMDCALRKSGFSYEQCVANTNPREFDMKNIPWIDTDGAAQCKHRMLETLTL